MVASTPTKTRSPNYPGMNLQEAIAKVAAIYKKEYNHPVAREVVAKHIGYGGINGASATAISTLVKYGLLEPTSREQVRVTSRAMTIIELKSGNPDRIGAIREAAFEPPLYTELHDQFGNRLPSDDNFRMYLIKRGFNPKAVGEVIRAYRDTMAFVDEEGAGLSSGFEPEDETEDEAPMDTMRTPVNPLSRSPVPFAPQTAISPLTTFDVNAEELTFRLATDSRAKVIFSGEVTQEAIAKLIALLELSKDVYPMKATHVVAHVEDAGHLLQSEYDNGQEEA